MAITSSSSATSTSHNKTLAGVHNLVNRTKKMRFPRRANRYLQQQDDIGYTDGQFMAPAPKSTPSISLFSFSLSLLELCFTDNTQALLFVMNLFFLYSYIFAFCFLCCTFLVPWKSIVLAVVLLVIGVVGLTIGSLLKVGILTSPVSSSLFLSHTNFTSI